MNNNNNNNNNRRSLGNIINRVFESAGPDGKVRGTPQQIIDKYQALARDAQLAGDRVAAESFLQHSEHYSRMLGEATQQHNEMRPPFDRDEVQRDDLRRDDDRRDDDPRGDAFIDAGRDQPRSQPLREQQPREQQPREQQPREQQPRLQQPRDPRPQQRDDARSRLEQQPNPWPAPPPPIASSLTTIDDPNEEGEFGGLIDTPESAASVAPLPIPEPPVVQSPVSPPFPETPVAETPVVQTPAPEPVLVAPNVNGATHPAAKGEAPADPPKPKRGRPRKKAPAAEGTPTVE